VPLPPALRERGGLLGHASMHAVTSNPTRTSPVKRGKWLLENVVGAPTPPPPPGNDTLKTEALVTGAATFRAQLAAHRAQKSCAVCHVRMDALGFALERYDAVGRHRDHDAAGAIDATGQLPDGRKIEGLAGLKAVLADDPAFVRTLLRKLFVYAVGRDAGPLDRLELAVLADDLRARGKVTIGDLVQAIVASAPFQQCEGR